MGCASAQQPDSKALIYSVQPDKKDDQTYESNVQIEQTHQDQSNTLALQIEDFKDYEINGLVSQIVDCVEEKDFGGELQAIQELRKTIMKTKLEEPISAFLKLINLLGDDTLVGHKQMFKCLIAQIAAILINKVFMSNKDGDLIPKSMKESMSEQVKNVMNIINYKKYKASEIVFYMDLIQAGVNVLQAGNIDKKNTMFEYAKSIVSATFSAVTGDYSELIELGKTILIEGQNALQNEIKKSWFLKSMKYLYTEVQPDSSQKIVDILFENTKTSKNENWHVQFAQLDLLERALSQGEISNYEKLDAIFHQFFDADKKSVEKLIELCVANQNPQFQTNMNIILVCQKVINELSQDQNTKKTIETFQGEIIELYEVLSKTWVKKQSEGEQVQEAIQIIDAKIDQVISKLDGRNVEELQLLIVQSIKTKIDKVEQLKMYIPENGVLDSKQLDKPDFETFDVFQKTDEFLQDNERKVLLIKGGPGTGKTLCVQHLTQSLLKDGKYGIPIYLRLSSLSNPFDNLVDKVLKQLIKSISMKEIERIQTSNIPFILILDGYDEIFGDKNLYTSNYLDQWNCKVIVTCRSQYIDNSPDYSSLFAAEDSPLSEIVLVPFNPSQIEEYLYKYAQLPGKTNESLKSWNDYQKQINTISGLKHLVQSPYILSMVCESLPQIIINTKSQTNGQFLIRLDVYQAFSQQWFEKRQIESRNNKSVSLQGLSLDLKGEYQKFTKKLAVKMFQKNLTEVKYDPDDEQNDWKEFFDELDEKQNIIRRGAPIQTVGDGSYCFLHKSQQEFFAVSGQTQGIASVLETKENGQSDLELQAINSQLITDSGLISFYIENIQKDEKLKQNLFKIIEMSKTSTKYDIAASNAISMLNAAKVNFNHMDLRNIRTPNANLSRSQFESADLSNAYLVGVDFTSSWLQHAKFDGANMTDVDFGELADLKQGGQILKLEYSDDGKKIYSTNSDQILEWDIETRQIVRQFVHYDVNNMIISPDQQLLASSGKEIKIWDLKSGVEIISIPIDVISFAFSPDGTKLIYFDGTYLTSFHLESKTEIIKKHVDETTKFIDWKNNTIMCCSEQGVLLMDGTMFQEYKRLEFEYQSSFSLSNDGNIFALGGNDIKLYDLKKDKYVQNLVGHSDWVVQMKFTQDGKLLASTGQDMSVRTWDTQSGKQINQFTGHKDWLKTIDWSPDEKFLASAGKDGLIKIWDNSKTKITNQAEGPNDLVFDVNFSADSKQIITASNRVQIFSSQTGKELKKLSFADRYAHQADFIDDNHIITQVFKTMIINIETKEENKFKSEAFSISKDRKCFVSLSEKAIEQYDVQTLQLIKTIPITDSQRQNSIKFSKYLAISNFNGQITLFDENFEKLEKFKGSRCQITQQSNVVHSVFPMSFSEGLFAYATKNIVTIFDLVSRKQKAAFEDQIQISAISFSLQKTIAIGNEIGQIKIWDLQTEKEIQTIYDNSSWISSISFSEDGKLMAVGSCDKSLKVYKIKEDGTVKLFWTSYTFSLSMKGMSTNGVDGLSSENQELIKQKTED